MDTTIYSSCKSVQLKFHDCGCKFAPHFLISIFYQYTEYATAEIVTKYYKVEKKTLQKLVERNRDELKTDGLSNKSYKEIKVLVNADNMSTLKIPPKGTLLFPKRAILRMGMLFQIHKLRS